MNYNKIDKEPNTLPNQPQPVLRVVDFLVDPYHILRSEREQRLLYFSFINLLAVIVVAVTGDATDQNLTQTSRTVSFAGAVLMLLFFIFISLLLYFSPRECVRSASPLYVCGILCISEFLIGGNGLGVGGSFAVRGVTYILVGTNSLVDSTGYIEWTLFRLVAAIALEIAGWSLLVMIHVDQYSGGSLLLIHHVIVSLVITIPLWSVLYLHLQKRFEDYIHPEERSKIIKTMNDFASPHSVHQAETNQQEPDRIVYNIDANAALIRTTQQPSEEFEEDKSSPQYQARFKLKREATKSFLCQKIMTFMMISLHVVIPLFVILESNGSISVDTENTVYAVCINAVIGLWQVSNTASYYHIWYASACSHSHVTGHASEEREFNS